MIIPVAALLAVLSSLLLGGRLRRLAEVRIRSTWTITTALITQIVVIEMLSGPRWLLSGAHTATYAAAAFFLLVNRRVPGLVVVAAGGASNGIAIALNGGTLPASASALRIAGIHEAAGTFTNSGVVGHARLAFLGDVFAIPDAWPLSNVFSVGDVLIMCGVGYASIRICGTRWTAPWSPRSAGHGRPRHLATATVRLPRIPAARRASTWATDGIQIVGSVPAPSVDSVHDQRYRPGASR
ncbi:MAG TPA: DUF5317 family protein [Kineosporiaceae bacterium]|nr:DUF5317 family protein [Kineosporiaceae bacterium]